MERIRLEGGYWKCPGVGDAVEDITCFLSPVRRRQQPDGRGGRSAPVDDAVRQERTAFTEGLRAFRAMLAEGGYEVVPDPVS